MKNTEFRIEQLLKSVRKLILSQQFNVRNAEMNFMHAKIYLNSVYPSSFLAAKKQMDFCRSKKDDLDLQKKELQKLIEKEQFYEKKLSLLKSKQ